MPILTAQQRTNGARKSAEVRRNQRDELVKLRALVAAYQEAHPPKPSAELKPDPSEILVRTREHIDAIDKLIGQCSDAKEMDALTRSREREWRIFAHLSNLPGPGNLKPSSKPTQARHATVQPIGPAPQPVVVSPTEPQP